MTEFTDLPSELVANIVRHLDDRDVFTTRLTARHVERSSLSYFGKRFFRKKGYMIISPSLDVLQQIAKHSELRKYVQHVWFNPDCFTFVRPDCAPDAEEAPDPDNPDSILQLLSPADRKMYEAYMECKKDHVQLLANSAVRLQALLASIFATLPNLKIIGMRRSEDHSPWGWRALQAAVGEDPRVLGPIPSGPMYFLSEPTRLFLALVNAVAASDVKLRRLYTDAIEIDNIRPDLLPHDVLVKACGPIWYLEVNITKAWLIKRAAADYIQLTEKDEYGNGLLNILQATIELREIGLQIFPERKRSGVLPPSSNSNPELWRSTYSYLGFQKVIDHVQLPHLTRIKLERITTSPTTLLAFLAPCGERLTSLKIRDVRLLSDTSHPKPWRSIFVYLSPTCTQLTHVLFYHLLYEGGGISFIEPSPMAYPRADASSTNVAMMLNPNPPPGEHAGNSNEQFFTKYEHIALQVQGRQNVQARLEEVVEKHWYHKPMFSYEMDDGVWHTDTSDEE